MFSGANAGLILFYILIGNSDEPYLAEFKSICLLSIVILFAVLTLNYLGLVNGTYTVIKSFCGLVFVLTSLILFWGKKHGLFNE